jgi:TonB family protein
MNSLKILTLLLLLSSTVAMAQSDTTFYNASGQKVKNQAIAQYFKVITTNRGIEIQEEFYTWGGKRSYYMYKKLPVVRDLIVVTGYTVRSGQSPDRFKTIPEPKTIDSVMIKHGTFTEWYETGELKMRGGYYAGKLHGLIETFFINKQLKRQDNYHLDTLKSGWCYDTLGKATTYFPFEVKPHYKDGDAAMYKFLANNIKYPMEAREQGIEGIVYMQFTIEKDGSMEDIQLIKSANILLNKEALRVLGLTTKWEGGKLDGEKVRGIYMIPIKFKLER